MIDRGQSRALTPFIFKRRSGFSRDSENFGTVPIDGIGTLMN